MGETETKSLTRGPDGSHMGVFCQGRGWGGEAGGPAPGSAARCFLTPPDTHAWSSRRRRQLQLVKQVAAPQTWGYQKGLMPAQPVPHRPWAGRPEGPHPTACLWKSQGWGQGSKAVYKALNPFMVPGDRLTIQRSLPWPDCLGWQWGSGGFGELEKGASPRLSLCLPAPLCLPPLLPTALPVRSQPSLSVGPPSRTAQSPLLQEAPCGSSHAVPPPEPHCLTLFSRGRGSARLPSKLPGERASACSQPFPALSPWGRHLMCCSDQ